MVLPLLRLCSKFQFMAGAKIFNCYYKMFKLKSKDISSNTKRIVTEFYQDILIDFTNPVSKNEVEHGTVCTHAHT